VKSRTTALAEPAMPNAQKPATNKPNDFRIAITS
jgi:hypothetical protein